MVVRIRLARWGRRNRPFYRIVAADARAKRDGRFLETLGTYNPISHSKREAAHHIKRVALNVQRIKYWLSVGAQPSETSKSFTMNCPCRNTQSLLLFRTILSNTLKVSRLLGAAGILPPAPRGTRAFSSGAAFSRGLADISSSSFRNSSQVVSRVTP